jgi:hypothetical protein
MASDGQLREWVSDKLMSLLGYSKNVVVQYVIRLGTLSFFSCCSILFLFCSLFLGLV